MSHHSLVLGIIAWITLDLSGAAMADVTVTWSDDGTDLTASYSGSFDLTGYGSPTSATATNTTLFYGYIVASFESRDGAYDGYTRDINAQGPDAFDISEIDGVYQSGDNFLFTSLGYDETTYLAVPPGYASGDPLAGVAVFAGETVDSVFGSNLASPQTMFDDGRSRIVFQTIPEPTTFALAALTTLPLLPRRRRRRRPHAS